MEPGDRLLRWTSWRRAVVIVVDYVPLSFLGFLGLGALTTVVRLNTIDAVLAVCFIAPFVVPVLIARRCSIVLHADDSVTVTNLASSTRFWPSDVRDVDQHTPWFRKCARPRLHLNAGRRVYLDVLTEQRLTLEAWQRLTAASWPAHQRPGESD